MLVTGFPAGAFQTNCYILALAEGRPGSPEPCVVIDPGQDAAPSLDELLDKHNLRPEAVLLTHGHLDHTWSVERVCATYGVAAYIHPEDRYMLADPLRGIGPGLQSLIGDTEFHEPDEVVELAQGQVLELAGMALSVDHTPGHTQGSVVFRVPARTSEGPAEVAFTGDTLFAGSIGRSDLPGGDHEQLLSSIGRRLLPLPDNTVVLPGHGGGTTVGSERAANPFLAGLEAGEKGAVSQ